MFSWPTFVAVFFSGIVGVTATIAYNFWAERRRLKVDCFRQLMRYGLNDDEFWRAFNEVPVIFAKCSKVLKAHMAAIDTSHETGSAPGPHMVHFIKVVAKELRMDGADERQLMSRVGTRRSN